MPDTLANAMAAGRPVLPTSRDLGRIVAETNCGILLTVNSTEKMHLWSKSNLRYQLGQNGRKREQKYNSSTVDELLINIYSQLRTQISR
jgi:hypothetical protein